jgi:hypothetical protein
MPAPSSSTPPASRLRLPELGRGWLGLLMVAAGLGLVRLVRPEPAAPARFAFLPQRGRAGMRVVLAGEAVRAARAVWFGATPAPFRAVDADHIEIRVPEGAGSAPITLVTGTGQTSTSVTSFQVLPGRPGPPTLARFWPPTGPPGTQVNLSGSGLQAVEGVTVAGRPADFVPVNDTALVVTVPLGLTRSGTILVTSPFGNAVTDKAYRPVAAR